MTERSSFLGQRIRQYRIDHNRPPPAEVIDQWLAECDRICETWLSTKDVAARYGRTPQNVARWCRLGLLPGAINLGRRRWYIPPEALDGFQLPVPGPKPRGGRA